MLQASLQEPARPSRLGPFADRDNGFGALRLAFATMVLLSHGPELIDGDRHREILTQIFGSLSFGELAVDGFFVISGALITASWMNAAAWQDFLWRRVMRIYPGFLAAFFLCFFLVRGLGGGTLPGLAESLAALGRALRLHGPDEGGAFEGQPYPSLNGALWSIPHEFNCYLMIGVLGLMGVLRRPRIILALAVAATVLAIRHYTPPQGWHGVSKALTSPAVLPSLGRSLWLEIKGQFWPYWRLVSLFLAGSLFHLFASAIPWRSALAWLSAAGLAGALTLSPPLAEAGFCLF